MNLDWMTATETVRRNIHHLVYRQDVIRAHVVMVAEGAWVVQRADQVVGQVVHSDRPHLLLAAAEPNRDRPLSPAYDRLEAGSAPPDDHAGPDDGHVETTVKQELLRLPAPAQPCARRVGCDADGGDVDRATYPVRLAGSHDVLRAGHFRPHEVLARRVRALGRQRVDADVRRLNRFQRLRYRRGVEDVALDDLAPGVSQVLNAGQIAGQAADRAPVGKQRLC